MRSTKIIAALLIIVIAAASLTGCYNPSTVLTIDGREITAGQYLYFQLTAFNLFSAQYTETTGQQISSLSKTFDLSLDDKSCEEWVAERTLELCRRFVYVENEFERLELEFSDWDLYYYKYSIQSTWASNQYAAYFTNNGINYDTFESIQLNSYKQAAIFSKLYIDNEGEKTVSDADIIEYFADNYARIDYFVYPSSGDDGRVVDAETGAKVAELVKPALDKLNAEGDLEAAYRSVLPEVFELLGRTGLENFDITTYHQTDVITYTGDTNLSAELTAQVIAADEGDGGLYQYNSLVYLYLVKPLMPEGNEWESYEAACVEALKSEEFDKYLTDGGAGLELEANQRAQRHYSARNIRAIANS